MGVPSHNNLYDRVNKLLLSYEWSDCCFSVCDKKFKAHKLILVISSPVFEAMFYGPLSTNEEISITDIEPHIFKLLLNYIYTDKVTIESIEDAYDLLYASRKYMLEYLSEICVSYIQSNMSIDNIITILSYPDYMQEPQLVSSALKLFCQHAEYLLKENKKCISANCLQKILKSNDMNIVEKDLIQSVFEWTFHYCDQNNIKNDFHNRREILIKSGLLKLLRFFTLSVNDLAEIVSCQNNLLLNNEAEDIEQVVKSSGDITNIIMPIFDTTTMPRKSMKLQWCLCHRTQIRSESPLVVDRNNFIVQTRVKANKSTFINTLIVPSRMRPVADFFSSLANTYHEQFSVLIECESHNRIISSFNFKAETEFHSNIDIKLEEPLLLNLNVWYKIIIIWPHVGPFFSHSYAVQNRDRCYSNGKIKFEFEDYLSISDNCGSFLTALKFCM